MSESISTSVDTKSELAFTVLRAILTAGIPALLAYLARLLQQRKQRRKVMAAAAAQLTPPEGREDRTLHERVLSLEAYFEDLHTDLGTLRTRIDANQRDLMKFLTERLGR
jgi:primosomal protein N''